MINALVCEILRKTAKILEIKGDNPFRIRAYERAAQNIESLSEDIGEVSNNNRLTEIPGIGVDLSAKVKEIVETGKLRYLDDLKKAVPVGLLELLNIPSVGPKTARLLYKELHINNMRALEDAIKKNKLTGIFGIKEKTVENISKGIGLLKKKKERMTLAQAAEVSAGFTLALKKLREVTEIIPAGSLRRQKETVRDIDLLVNSDKPKLIMERFISLPGIKEVLAKGGTKASVRTKEDIQIDCRVVEDKSFGAALLYFTGSKGFNIKIRQLAVKKGLKVNEYGVFKNERFVCGKTEEEIFKYLGMQYIEPELREDTGEIESAISSQLPALVKISDIKGDLHAHSSWSDGNNTIEEIALACRGIGYGYVAITDHSQGLKVAGGLNISSLRKKKQEIDRINKKFSNFRVLYAAEVDIGSDGKLDYSEKELKGFDVVVAAIHAGFKQSKEQLTKRIIKACQNKSVHIIAHPTGRLWGEREAYELDFEEIFKAARDTNTCLEINSSPQRLDLNDLNCRYAKEKGVRLAVNTDAHLAGQLENMKLGVSVARRGWLTAKDVINTLPLDALLKTIRK